MRESVLRDLYFGEISPWERRPICTREYREITGEIIRIEDHFKSLLSPEEYAKIEEMQELRARADIMESIDLFTYAFRTGALMMIDVFNYTEKD